MEVVDAHMHLWTPETHPWLLDVKDGGHPAGKFEPVMNYLVEDYKKDIEGYNVVQSIHVEAVWPGDPVGESIWLDGLAESNATGIPNAIVGFCDLSSADAETILQRQCQHKRIKGIRNMLNYHDKRKEFRGVSHDNYLTDPNWIRGFALLEKYNLSFELHILPSQMMRAAAVVEQHPGVMVMLNHCGIPWERDPQTLKVWREGLEALAKCPNVYVKVSALFCIDAEWTQTSLESVAKPVLEIFGIDRCVFASNFPVDKINGSFKQLMSALEPILDSYSKEDKQKFFAGNARKFYRLSSKD